MIHDAYRFSSFARLILVTASLMGVVSRSSAQPRLEAQFNVSADTYDDAERRAGVYGYFNAEILFAGERGRLFYRLDHGTYSSPGDWSTFLHELGTVYRLGLDADGKSDLFLGGSFSSRINGDSWEAADYRGLGAFANMEIRPRENTTVRLGYRLDSRRFPEMVELDQTEHGAFGSLLVNFPSRTTLIGEVHIGEKSYAGEPLVVARLGSAPTGLGKGQRGVGPNSRTGVTLSDATGAHAGQVTWLARLAQSVADRTGFSVELSRRTAFGSVPPALVTTPPLFFEDGVYDDPFASNARNWRVALKHLLSGGSALEIGGFRLQKDYTGTLALDPNGDALGELRQDDVWGAGAAYRLPLLPDRTGVWVLDLELAYRYIRHHSNDAFYNYASHGLLAGMSLAY